MNGESIALDPGSFIGWREKDNRGNDKCQHDHDNQESNENSFPVTLSRVTGDELLEQNMNAGYPNTLPNNVVLHRVCDLSMHQFQQNIEECVEKNIYIVTRFFLFF